MGTERESRCDDPPAAAEERITASRAAGLRDALLGLHRSAGIRAVTALLQRQSQVLVRGGGRKSPEREWKAPPGTRFGELLDRGGRFRFWGFDVDSATPKPEFRVMMLALAGILTVAPKATITIEGHTSASGTAKHNEALGLRRAEAIAAQLEKLGVEPWRVDWIAGRGESRLLLAENGDPARMALNRRVEVELHRPQTAATPTKPPPAGPAPVAGDPCNYCDFEIRWLTGLKRALTLSLNRRDTGGAKTIFRPEWKFFQMALRTEGFSQDEVDRMWSNYAGEPEPYHHLNTVRRFDHDIAYFKKALKHCDASRTLQPTLLLEPGTVRPTTGELTSRPKPPVRPINVAEVHSPCQTVLGCRRDPRTRDATGVPLSFTGPAPGRT